MTVAVEPTPASDQLSTSVTSTAADESSLHDFVVARFPGSEVLAVASLPGTVESPPPHPASAPKVMPAPTTA